MLAFVHIRGLYVMLHRMGGRWYYYSANWAAFAGILRTPSEVNLTDFEVLTLGRGLLSSNPACFLAVRMSSGHADGYAS